MTTIYVLVFVFLGPAGMDQIDLAIFPTREACEQIQRVGKDAPDHQTVCVARRIK